MYVGSVVGGIEGIISVEEYRTGGMVRPSAAARSGKIMIGGVGGIVVVGSTGVGEWIKMLMGSLEDGGLLLAKRLIIRSIVPVGCVRRSFVSGVGGC